MNSHPKEYLNKLKEIEKLIEDEINKHILIDTPELFSREAIVEIHNFVFRNGTNSGRVYDLYNYFRAIINKNANEFRNKLTGKTNSEIIDLFLDISNKMEYFIYSMSKAFNFISDFVRRIAKFPLIKIALEKEENILYYPIEKSLMTEVNKLLLEDRLGKKDNRSKIKKIINLVKAFDLHDPKLLYKENKTFIWESEKKEEKPFTYKYDEWIKYFISKTEKFLAEKIKEDIQKHSIPEFISIQLKFLEEEKQRLEELFDEEFFKRLNDIIYKKIIGDNMKKIIEDENGLKNMLENNKHEELTNLYELFKLYETSLKELEKFFVEYVKKRGKHLNEDEEIKTKPELFEQKLNELQKEINEIVEKCFKNNEVIQTSVKKAFNELMNTNNK